MGVFGEIVFPNPKLEAICLHPPYVGGPDAAAAADDVELMICCRNWRTVWSCSQNDAAFQQ